MEDHRITHLYLMRPAQQPINQQRDQIYAFVACEQRRPWLHPRYLPLLIGNIFPEQADTGSDGRHARQARQLIRAAKRGQQPHQGMVHLIP
ncbi:hypothetical protein Bca101_004754 [Brassica carinata]